MGYRSGFLAWALALALTALSLPSLAQPIAVDAALVIEPGAPAERSLIFTDPIEKALVDGSWKPPNAGDSVRAPDGGELVWRELATNEEGWLEDDALAGGYAFANVEVAEAGVYMLEARGHRHVYVNGVPRGGDAYNLGFVRTPIELRAGSNDLLFKVSRGRLQAHITHPESAIFLEARDTVLPTIIRGERPDALLASIMVTNATAEWQNEFHIRAYTERRCPVEIGPAMTQTAKVPDLAPLVSTRVVIVFVPCPTTVDSLMLHAELVDSNGQVIDDLELRLDVKNPGDKHVRTFQSEIDGSVQYYGVTPPPAVPDTTVGLILTLHGAGVDGGRQAHHYQARDWAYIVSPTNRRPFGFDWEDWGRVDALEVLADAQTRFATDPARTWLTGHSMGGHGTWNLGAHFPDRFGALGASAAWRDFWSYGGAADWNTSNPLEALLARAGNASRTLLLERNYTHHGVYVLHGDLDASVPVEQARFMRERLARFHPNWTYYERQGAGHWWGDECMDWPPMIDFLRANPIPASRTMDAFSFTTVNPRISSRCHWVEVIRQAQSLEPSTVTVENEDEGLHLTTDNIVALTLDMDVPDAAGNGDYVDVQIDGDALSLPRERVYLVRQSRGDDVAWELTAGHDPGKKGPHRAGPFKEELRQHLVFVVATKGTDAENAWSLAKARYDAETFYYRGGGAVEIIRDVDYATAYTSSNLVIYGHREMNDLWRWLLDERCPIRVDRDAITIGDDVFEGQDLACLFVYPRSHSNQHSVAVVCGTGPAGEALTHQQRYFVSRYTFCSIDRTGYVGMHIDSFVSALSPDMWMRCRDTDAGWAEIGMAFNAHIAELARDGGRLIADTFYALPSAREHLFATIGREHVFDVLLYCDLAELERRERLRGDRRRGLARCQFDRVYAFDDYDLRIDSTALSVSQCAHRLVEATSNF